MQRFEAAHELGDVLVLEVSVDWWRADCAGRLLAETQALTFASYGRMAAHTYHTGVKCMLDQHRRAALEQQQWIIDVHDVSPLPHNASLVELWKMYANGVAVTLSIQNEQGQFVVYADVGHAAAGTNRIECGRFSGLDAAVDQLIQTCCLYDGAWET
jgi:hypothetical protein